LVVGAAEDELAQDAVLVVSELVSNGIAEGDVDEIVVRAERRDLGVEIEVVTVPDRDAARPADVGQGDNRAGMAVVEAVSDDVTVETDEAGRRHVRCLMGGHLTEPVPIAAARKLRRRGRDGLRGPRGRPR
jgi:hypothetical protein